MLAARFIYSRTTVFPATPLLIKSMAASTSLNGSNGLSNLLQIGFEQVRRDGEGGYSIAAAAAAMVATEVLEVFVLLADALREIIQEKRHKRFERIRREERERLFGSGVPTFCPIWGTPAKVLPTARAAAVFVIDSQRAGGKYEISRQLLTEIVTGSLRLAEQDRDAVTQWLSDQRAAGVDLPVLTVEVMRNLIRPDWGSENSHTE
ncbi:MAG: hypothetical protein OXP69_11920 [Spirochaetaceae bacterium]|nr:hypothetical protein [Spirochaetaceae bacterium]